MLRRAAVERCTGSGELFGVRPDLATYCKAIANGYPLSACLGRDSLKQAALEVFFTGSYFTSAVPMAASLATLKELQACGGIERMRTIAAAEGIEIDDAALGEIAYRADGGLRDALTMLEQTNSFGGGHVDLAAIEGAFGATGQATARSRGNSLARRSRRGPVLRARSRPG